MLNKKRSASQSSPHSAPSVESSEETKSQNDEVEEVSATDTNMNAQARPSKHKDDSHHVFEIDLCVAAELTESVDPLDSLSSGLSFPLWYFSISRSSPTGIIKAKTFVFGSQREDEVRVNNIVNWLWRNFSLCRV